MIEIPEQAREHWLALNAALAELSDPTPCQHPARLPLWYGRTVEEREAAAHHCRSGCPVLTLCGQYATAADERHGVWAGVSLDEVQAAARRRRRAG